MKKNIPDARTARKVFFKLETKPIWN